MSRFFHRIKYNDAVYKVVKYFLNLVKNHWIRKVSYTVCLKYQMLSTKFQVPNFKYQIPSTKCQAPNSKFYPLQTTDHRPNSKGAVGKRTRPKPQKPPCPGPKGWRLLWFLVRGNKFQVPNTKFQAPSTKHQAPNSKFHPLPTTDHRPQTKFQRRSGEKNEAETTKTSLPRP